MSNATNDESNVEESPEMVDGYYFVIVPRIMGSISALSSMVIIYVIFKAMTKLKSTYHRIMFGMSIGDIIASIGMSLTHLPMPAPGINPLVDLYISPDYRIGTIQTCNIQGFMIMAGTLLNYMYNAALCWYYYFVIVKTMKDNVIAKRIEPFLHCIPILLSLSYGITLYLLRAYNPDASFCLAGKLHDKACFFVPI